MPMNKVTLGALMKSKVDAIPDPAVGESISRTAIFEAIAEAVIEHISSSAQISGVIVTVASVTAVTPGMGVSGPGTGTGTAPPGSIT